jgi:PTH1 family peptidyl-tRNA hydrolase
VLKLVVGIGNPGSQYEHTRHNAGAWFIEKLLSQYQRQLRLEKKFSLEVAEIHFENKTMLLAKTTSFMNESGQGISAFAHFLRIPSQEILIAHDDLDLPPGSVRLKLGGGHGGHNGLRDIIKHLNTPDFYRLRIGIGHPGNKDQVHDYVLHKPGTIDRTNIDQSIDRAIEFFPEMLSGNFTKAMNELHQQTS